MHLLDGTWLKFELNRCITWLLRSDAKSKAGFELLLCWGYPAVGLRGEQRRTAIHPLSQFTSEIGRAGLVCGVARIEHGWQSVETCKHVVEPVLVSILRPVMPVPPLVCLPNVPSAYRLSDLPPVALNRIVGFV